MCPLCDEDLGCKYWDLKMSCGTGRVRLPAHGSLSLGLYVCTFLTYSFHLLFVVFRLLIFLIMLLRYFMQCLCHFGVSILSPDLMLVNITKDDYVFVTRNSVWSKLKAAYYTVC